MVDAWESWASDCCECWVQIHNTDVANMAIYPWFARLGILGVSNEGASVSVRARKDAWMGGLPEIEALRHDEVECTKRTELGHSGQ